MFECLEIGEDKGEYIIEPLVTENKDLNTLVSQIQVTLDIRLNPAEITYYLNSGNHFIFQCNNKSYEVLAY